MTNHAGQRFQFLQRNGFTQFKRGTTPEVRVDQTSMVKQFDRVCLLTQKKQVNGVKAEHRRRGSEEGRQRADRIRDLLGIGDFQHLNDRDVRNALEHLDQRIYDFEFPNPVHIWPMAVGDLPDLKQEIIVILHVLTESLTVRVLSTWEVALPRLADEIGAVCALVDEFLIRIPKEESTADQHDGSH